MWCLSLPERAENEPGNGCQRERGHRLLLDRLVDRSLEVAGDVLHPLAGLAALRGNPARRILRTISEALELVRGLVRHSLQALRRSFLSALCHIADTPFSCSWAASRRTSGSKPGSLLPRGRGLATARAAGAAAHAGCPRQVFFAALALAPEQGTSVKRSLTVLRRKSASFA